MNWNAEELKIYNQALSMVEDTNEDLIIIYKSVEKEIQSELKKFFISMNDTWTEQYTKKRLESLFNNIDTKVNSMIVASLSVIELSYLEQYKNTLYSYAYGLSKNYSDLKTNEFLMLPFEPITDSVIKETLLDPIGRYNFREFGRYAKKKLIEDLKEQIIISIDKGENPVKLAKRLKEQFGDAIARHTATARTELLKAYSLAQEEATNQALEMGIEFEYQWLGRNDGRERLSHIAVNNKFAKKDKNGKPVFYVGASKGSSPRLLEGSDSAAQNINCRCRRLNIPGKMTDEEKENFPVINGIPSYTTYIQSL